MPSGSSQENTSFDPAYGSAVPDAEVSTGNQQPSLNFADILEQILATAEDPANAKADPCHEELLAIASRNSSLGFCTDPVLIELIQAVTRRIKGLSASRLLAMERAVAGSLVDDPVSHARLQNFWEQLKMWASNGQ